MTEQSVRVMAVASFGGHYQQLMALEPALRRHETLYVTTRARLGPDGRHCSLVTDCNAATGFKAFRCGLQMIRLMMRERPDLVISTGALPGLLAILTGRIFGARTLWIDSVANAERLSASGRVAKWFATKTLSQWQQVAEQCGVEHHGSTL